MILALRRRHRAVFSVLALALPAIFASALLSRDPLPLTESIPEALAVGVNEELLSQLDWIRTGSLWEGLGIEAAAHRGGNGAREILLRPTRDLALPKALVYWVPGGAVSGRLPDDAVLAGSLAGRQIVRLSPPPSALGGQLVVYSLGHQRVVAEAPAPVLSAGRGRRS